MNIAARPGADNRSSLIARTLSYLRRNELTDAAFLLSRALAHSPGDPAFLYLLGTVRRLQHRPADAEDFYRRSLASFAAQSQVHRDLGKLVASLGRLDEAVVEFREALRLKPGDEDSHLCLAAALARQGLFASAEASYRNVLSLQPGHAVARLGLAETLCQLGRAADAEHLLRHTPSAREPALAAAFAYRLGIALKQQKKYSQALALFDAAQAQQQDYPAVDFVRGETFQQMGLWEQAGHCFRGVLARLPGHVNAAGCLALISALAGDFTEARNWAAKALAHVPTHNIAHIALALVEIENGDHAAASERMRALLENPAATRSEGTAVASGFVADAFDRHQRYSEAFAVSRDSKTMLRRLWTVENGTRRMTDIAQESVNYLQTSDRWIAANHSNTDTSQPVAHVFVLGFLRSGTTLIETILATHADVVHADEIDFLADAARALFMDARGLERLAALPDAEIARWRENYWNAVSDAHFSLAAKIFVDKMPINTFRLPLIARLFPAAKIVLAIRDPRDVVLSCFRRHFDCTPYSREFLRLDDCARLYAAAMTLAEECRKKVPLDILELRYEDIVDNFDPTVRALCGFAGIAWNEDMRDFRQAAEKIDLRGASARQVRRGLYSGAAGHWRHYRDELAPVLPILAPWVARYGYPAE